MVSCPALLSSSPLHPADDLQRALEERFRLASLYAWQGEAIDVLVGGAGRVLVVAPTGGGKSLCYQLPAAVLPGTAVVISPLISLMEDQVRSLEQRGIAATFVASTLAYEERAERLRAIRAGKFKIVYVAPERLTGDGFLELLGKIELSLLAVDEAHCIVQWGHDFRPDYLRIGGLIERLRPKRVLACTATATPESRREILVGLRLDAASTRVILRGFARPNLELSVREVEGSREALRITHDALVRALGRPEEKGAQPRGAAIIYAATRRVTEKWATELADRGWGARAYHAGLPSEERTLVQRDFAEKSLSVVVATNAFGMGIDRPDVRIVVHAQPPGSIESYYQEVGRAGRDGAPARGVLIVAPGDIPLRRRMCELGSDGTAAPPDQAARAWGLFRELLRYVDASSCRHDFILRYFGDEAESLGGCKQCDVCRRFEEAVRGDPEAVERNALTVRKALSGVARAKGRGGLQAIAEMLRGDATARVMRFGFDQLTTFGLLAGESQEQTMRIFRALMAKGWVDLRAGDYPTPYLTAAGARVMRGEEAPGLLLPAPLPAAPPPPRERAKGATSKGTKRRAAELGEAVGVDGVLLEALRVHRLNVAMEAGVPAYVVAHDRTLVELAARRPTCLDELEDIPGFGPVKIARYGAGFVSIVRRCAAASGT